jgi:hypothetical protein
MSPPSQSSGITRSARYTFQAGQGHESRRRPAQESTIPHNSLAETRCLPNVRSFTLDHRGRLLPDSCSLRRDDVDVVRSWQRAAQAGVRRAVLCVSWTRVWSHSFVFCIQGGTRIPPFKILMIDRNVVMAVEPDSLVGTSSRDVDVVQVHLDRGESNAKAPGMTQQVS